MSLCFVIVCGCFYSTMAGLNSYNKTPGPTKPKIFTIVSFAGNVSNLWTIVYITQRLR